MEWWQVIISLASAATLTVAAWGLKTLVDIKAEVAGMTEWAKSVERRFNRLSAGETLNSSGMKKIVTYVRKLAGRVEVIERKVDDEV
jgi:hypothetical protein